MALANWRITLSITLLPPVTFDPVAFWLLGFQIAGLHLVPLIESYTKNLILAHQAVCKFVELSLSVVPSSIICQASTLGSTCIIAEKAGIRRYTHLSSSRLSLWTTVYILSQILIILVAFTLNLLAENSLEKACQAGWRRSAFWKIKNKLCSCAVT